MIPGAGAARGYRDTNFDRLTQFPSVGSIERINLTILGADCGPCILTSIVVCFFNFPSARRPKRSELAGGWLGLSNGCMRSF